MRLSETIEQLGRLRRIEQFQPAGDDNRLANFGGFGSNPGALGAGVYVPDGLTPRSPLAVVLHGCTQNAAGYDQGSGWSRLAERHGFALLFPEQTRSNNPNLCFNWYQAQDASRGRGEAASIAAMVKALCARHQLDPDRVFITGLSAGGAMAGVMLASYPELFAAGAIIAGLPFGCASDVRGAFDLMAGRLDLDGRSLGEKVRRASSQAGAWPRVSIWHGSADRTVVPGNADALVRQWSDVHQLTGTPPVITRIGSHSRKSWTGRDGQVLVEQVVVAGMGHGTPLRPGEGEGESGQAMAHMLDVGLSSTDHIAAFFGIAPAPATPSADVPSRHQPFPRRPRPAQMPEIGEGSVQQVIEQALRKAGLMK